MKLNPDCVRDILLTVEEVCDGDDFLHIDEDYDLESDNFLYKYNLKEILYHIRQCNMCGFFIGCSSDYNDGYLIMDLSPEGHEFLADIRSNSIWNKVKKKSEQIGVKSLGALSQIAISVTTALINESLTL